MESKLLSLYTLSLVIFPIYGSNLSATLANALAIAGPSDCVAISLDIDLPSSLIRQLLESINIPYCITTFPGNNFTSSLGTLGCYIRLAAFINCHFVDHLVKAQTASLNSDVAGTFILVDFNPYCRKKSDYANLTEHYRLVPIKRRLHPRTRSFHPNSAIPSVSLKHEYRLTVWNPEPTNERKTLRLALFHHEPSIVVHKSHPEQRNYYGGSEVELIKTFTELYNFQLEYVDVPETEKWGLKNASGVWFGLLGKVNRSEVDFGVANLFMTSEYVAAVDMSYPFDTECAAFLVPGPVVTPRWKALMEPFSGQLWILTFGVFVIVGISLPVLSKIYYCVVDKHPGGFYQRWGLAYFYTCQMVTGIAAGGDDAGNPWTVRIYVSILWAFFYLLTTDYRAVLTAYLSIPSETAPIDSGIQLLQSNIEWGGTAAVNVFKHSESPIDLLLNQSYKVLKNVDIQSGVELVAEGKFALMENRRWFEYVVATSHQDNLHITQTCFSSIPVAVALARPSKIKPLLNSYIFRLRSTGLFDYWAESTARVGRTFAFFNTTSRSNDQDSLIFSLYKLQSAFYLLILGYLPACLAFIVENVHFNK